MKDNKYIEPSDVYKELWEGRNFELSHLWQRSIFLATILVALMAGYGAIVLNIVNAECNTKTFFDKDSKIIIRPGKYSEEEKNFEALENTLNAVEVVGLVTQKNQREQTILLNGMALCLSIVGGVFSILWIMMGKGSKRWSERYEESLNWYIKRYCSDEVNSAEDFPSHGNLVESNDEDDSITSMKSGHYSVSRINTCIGLVCWIAWTITSVVHLTVIFLNWITEVKVLAFVISVAVIIVLNMGIIAFFKFYCKSWDA